MKILRKIFVDEVAFLFSCPALLWEWLFLYIPLSALAMYSFVVYVQATQTYAFSAHYYAMVLNSLYFRAILNSLILAFSTAIICLLIAYPVALFLATRVPQRFKNFLLFTLILPSWTSLVIQIYAWFFLLEKDGFLSKIVHSLGILSPATQLLNNYFSVMVGMVSCFLPFMILPIYVTLDKIDSKLIEASADLGASRAETFRRITLPLSLPGVYTGLLLVFVPVFGEFAIPSMLGSSTYVFWGSLIVDKFLRARDWPFGSALAMVGILLVILLIACLVTVGKLIKRIRGAN